MQSYYQYFIALVSAPSVILSSESHNSVNFCLIVTNWVSKPKLRTCLKMTPTLLIDLFSEQRFFISNLRTVVGTPDRVNA